jgi:hypothetical protein
MSTGETGFVAPDRPQESGGAHVLALLKLTLRSVPRTGTGAPAPSSLQHHNAWVARTLGACSVRVRCDGPLCSRNAADVRAQHQRVILVRVHTLPRVQRLRLVCADHGCGLGVDR